MVFCFTKMQDMFKELPYEWNKQAEKNGCIYTADKVCPPLV